MSDSLESQQSSALINRANEIADRHSCNALLNCYIREFVLPANQLTIKKDQHHKQIIYFPVGAYTLSARIAKASLSGFFTINSQIIATDHLGNENIIDYLSLLSLINHHLSQQQASILNIELLLQAKNSLQNMAYFVSCINDSPIQTHFIDNEQQLVFGHEFHPTPKARYGINGLLMCKLSPEISAKFRLHYFKVPKHLIHSYASQAALPPLFKSDQDFIYYPLHPWQAAYLLSDKKYQKLLADLSISSVGIMGDLTQATSSVRTLFTNSDDYMYKFSLHIRLTNCLRKNAIYELESAVSLSRLLKQRNLTDGHPNVTLLYEPNAYTLALSNLAEHIHLKEIFGVILRENIPVEQQHNTYVALKLFSANVSTKSTIEQLLQQRSRQTQQHYTVTAQQWFVRYCQILIPFVLESFCHKGIVFEPHLQNIIVHLNENHELEHLYIRDLEGTKLCLHHWRNNPQELMSENVFYDGEQSFRRIAYCLIFNHLASAIHYIASDSFSLEQSLWQIVHKQILKLRHHSNDLFTQQQLDRLLTSKSLPYKANLLTRFLKSADRNAHYIDLPNPLLMEK